jgi:acetyl esterase/lipase
MAFSFTNLVACSGTKILNDFLITRDGYSIHRDIAYGDNARQKMDIYVPDNLTAKAPVIVFFYGGSWRYGSKDQYLFAGQAFASKGYVAVIADYRLYPEVYYPDFLKDSANAFAYVHAHIGEYGGDPDKLFLAGHSAGAYNAMMLTVDDQLLKDAGAKKSWIRGTIGIAGPYDFLPLTDPKLIDMFSTASDIKLTQPINYIHSKQPPIFMAHGKDDDLVGITNTQHVDAKLQALHSPVEVHYYDGVGHIGIALSLAQHFRDKDPLLDDIAHFVDTESAK